MARVEEAIYNILKNSTGVTDYVSTRIYPASIPQDCTLPAICYERISTMRHFCMDTDPNIAETIIDVTIISSSLSVAGTVAEQVRNNLNKHTGTHASMVIDDIQIENEGESYFSDLKEYELSLSFKVLHRETTS